MSDLIPFDSIKAPAHISNLFGSAQSNIQAGASIPAISFRGKVWRIHKDGETMELLDEEGNPRPSLEVIVVNQNPNRSRTYFDKKWGENGSDKLAPRCTSDDGVVPNAYVQNPVAPNCSECPMAVKGSRINDNGTQTTACGQNKVIAVVPAHDPDYSILQIRLPITSVFDGNNKENESKGWYAWDQYMKMLISRGVSHTAAVVTKIRFDAKESYPKLLFNAAAWLDDARAQKILPRLTSDDVVKACGTLENRRKAQSQTRTVEVTAPAPAPAPAPTHHAAPVQDAEAFGGSPKKVADAPVTVAKKPEPTASAGDGALSDLLGTWDD